MQLKLSPSSDKQHNNQPINTYYVTILMLFLTFVIHVYLNSEKEMPTYAFKTEDIINEGRITRREIEEIREWTKTQKVPILNDEQIVIFILACEKNVNLTKNTILEYYQTRVKYKELFTNRNVKDEAIQSQLQAVEVTYFPKRTKAGEAIAYHKITDSAFWKYNIALCVKLMFMTIDAAVYRYPPTGLIILFDMDGASIMHLTRIRLNMTRAFSHYCQEALPAKLSAIHVLNTQYFVEQLMAFFKPFLKPELYSKLHFHPPSLNLEEFHEIYVEKSCLPSDYGGTLKSRAELHADNIKLLENMREFFEDEERQRTEYFHSY